MWVLARLREGRRGECWGVGFFDVTEKMRKVERIVSDAHEGREWERERKREIF